MSDDVTSIQVSKDLWKELNQRKEPGDTFEDVIRRELGIGEHDTDTREREIEPEPEPASDPEPAPDPQAAQIEAIVDVVATPWDADDRLETRKAAAREALARALDAHSVGKSDLVEELREAYPVEGQSPDTYWRKNIQPVFSALPTAHYEQRYTGWVVDGLCDVDELELE